MEQLSRPYQIALGAILVFALAYFLVLKPGGDEPVDPLPAPAASAPAAPTAPGVAGLGRAVDKANGAATQSDESAKATQDAAAAASGESVPEGAPPGGAAPGPPPGEDATPGGGRLEPEDASRTILDDVANQGVAVVLFYNAKGADDRAVRRALKDVPRFKGKVRVRQIPIERVADYPAITQGVPVTQAPTLLVIDKDKRARRLVGYQDTASITQLVSDVGGARLRSSGKRTYVDRVETLCNEVQSEVDASPRNGDVTTEEITGLTAEFASALKAARGLEVARGFSRFQSAFEQNLELNLVTYRAAAKVERTGGTAAATLRRASPKLERQDAALKRVARTKGIRGC